MTTETFVGTADSAYGTKLPETLKFEVKAELFDSYDEMVAQNALLSPAEQLKARNTQIRNKARASAQQAAFDAAGIVKPTLEDSEELRIMGIAKSFIAKGMDPEKARARAVKILAELDSEL